MTDLSLTGQVLSMIRCNNAVNIFVVDNDNPHKAVYKVTFWDNEASNIPDILAKGDEITVDAKIFDINSNQHGNYIDLRMCKLISYSKIQRITVQVNAENVVEGNPLPQEGE